jgi:hypothetical protein
MNKTRITFYISQDMVEKAKNAAYWTPGMTLSSLAEQALDLKISDMEKGRQGPFPRRENELAKGRPAK